MNEHMQQCTSVTGHGFHPSGDLGANPQWGLTLSTDMQYSEPFLTSLNQD